METDINIDAILVSSDEAARLLGMSKRSLERLDDKGKLGPLPVKFLKGRVLWSVEELRAWVRAGWPGRAEWQIQLKRKTE